MSSMCRSWACGCSSARRAESTGGAYTEVDVVGRPKGFIRAAHVQSASPSTTPCSRARCGSSCTARPTSSRAGDADHDPARHAAHAAPGRRTPGRIRIRLTPERAQRRVLRAPGRAATTTASASRSPSRRAIRQRARRVRPRRPPEPEDPAAARRALLDSEYVFVDEWDVAAPPEAVFDTLADGTHLPALVEAGLHRRRATASTPTSTSRAACRTTCTRAPGPTTPSARTRSRARPTATCAAPASGRSRRTGGGTHVRFDWRVHADRRLLKLLTPLLRPRCAGTTTGPSPARSRASSPTCANAKVAV